MGIYRGLTVLEVAGDIPGAVAGLACADRGAEVILVEPPAGNALRHVDAYAEGESKIFQALHRGKKSVVLDPVTNARTLSALIGDADIVIASATEHSPVFDIDYELARALNPEVIYVEATAFGQDGPWAGRHANDLVMQAFGGTMMTEGKKRTDGVTPSVIQSTRYAGFGTGLMLNIAISSALLHRARTGQGQKVETSLLHNLLALQGGRASDNDLADKRSRPARQKMLEARRQGASLKDITRPVPVIINPFYRAYQTRDGAIFVGALTRGLRDKARIALDTDLMARDDPNWDPYDPAQLAEAAEEQRAIEHHVKQKSTAEWLAILEAAGVPTGEVVFPEDLAQTRHLYDNDYLVEVTHDTAGKTLQVAPPVRYGRFPAPEFKGAPTLGRDTPTILKRYA